MSGIKRKCLIVAGHDPNNDAIGAIVDLKNFKNFLMSRIGGEWRSNEITTIIASDEGRNLNGAINNRAAYITALADLKNADYAMFIYSGHGGHQNGKTMLEIFKGSKLENEDYVIENLPSKGTMILDCCRMKMSSIHQEAMATRKIILCNSSPAFTRDIYDEKIKNASSGVMKLYSCNLGEASWGDSLSGGLYSKKLISAAENTTRNLSLYETHSAAVLSVKRSSDNKQNPVINIGLNFPFAIVG